MNKDNLKTGGIVIAIILGIVAILGHSTVVQEVNRTFGGTSPDITSPYVNFGGVIHWYSQASFNQASSTLCSLQSPVATSSLVTFTADFKSTPSYATAYMVGSGTRNATTTSIIAVTQISLASSAFGSTAASSTAMGTIIPPNTFINLNVSTSTGSTVNMTPSGTCSAEWIQVAY